MKKSNVTKLKSNQGLTVYSVYCAHCAFCDFWALRQTSNGTFGEKNGATLNVSVTQIVNLFGAGLMNFRFWSKYLRLYIDFFAKI